MFPNYFAVCFVETEHAFVAGNNTPLEWVATTLARLAIGQVNASTAHRRAGVTGMHGHAPLHLQPGLGKFLKDARLAPDPIALRPEPLRPVIRARGPNAHQKNSESTESHRGFLAGWLPELKLHRVGHCLQHRRNIQGRQTRRWPKNRHMIAQRLPYLWRSLCPQRDDGNLCSRRQMRNARIMTDEQGARGDSSGERGQGKINRE